MLSNVEALTGLYDGFKPITGRGVFTVSRRRRFTVALQPAEEGGFVAKCFELPVASQGETREEALANIREAIEGYLETRAELLSGKAEGERVEVVVEAPSAILA